MTLAHGEIINRLNAVTSTEDEHQLDILQGAVDAIKNCPEPSLTIPALFGVFERFPEDDGYGVFWSILHTLEALPGYEPHLIYSVNRSPGEFNLLMVNRLINGGITAVGTTDLMGLLESVATSPSASTTAKQSAMKYFVLQRDNRT